VAAPAPVAAPAAAPSAPARIKVAPERVEAFYKAYSDANLNDQQSVGMLLEEAANIAQENILTQISTNPAIIDGLVKKVRDAGFAQAKQSEAINKTVKAVESWWEAQVPGANPEDLWAFGPIAARTHPVPLGATLEQARAIHAKQAFFCLQRYLAIRGVLPNPANDAINRGQGPVIPGGGGAPSMGAAGGEGKIPTMQEQLLANRRGERI
jgi:hypothetical protein